MFFMKALSLKTPSTDSRDQSAPRPRPLVESKERQERYGLLERAFSATILGNAGSPRAGVAPGCGET
jgi:hypothetical protein